MSLINEALKKAQRQRSLSSAPLSAAPSGVAAAAVTTHVRAASHKRSYAMLWFGVGLVSLGAVASGLVMRYGVESSPSTATAVPVKATTPASIPTNDSASAATKTGGASASPDKTSIPETPMIVLPPLAAPRTEAPASTVTLGAADSLPPESKSTRTTAAAEIETRAAVNSPTSIPARSIEMDPTPVSSPAPVVPVVAVSTPAEREAKVYAFLSGLRLTGVRGQDRDARVLMNERVWRLNDTVSPELGLRLSAIRPGLLVFTDAQGKTYEKPY